jgi:response regulator of citrate/malate metabolism
VQYLVKPFTFGVFRERLEQYAQARELRTPRGRATQAEIDALLGAGRTAPIPVTPKGISPETLDAVGRALREGEALSAVETARLLGLSRVSARRYLEHLVEIGAAERRARHGRPGRPESEYRWSM